MKVKVPAEVTGISKRSEYYPKTGEYTVSTLTIIKNAHNIEGSLTVREPLEFGTFVEIVVNTDKNVKETELASEGDLQVTA